MASFAAFGLFVASAIQFVLFELVVVFVLGTVLFATGTVLLLPTIGVDMATTDEAVVDDREVAVGSTGTIDLY